MISKGIRADNLGMFHNLFLTITLTAQSVGVRKQSCIYYSELY